MKHSQILSSCSESDSESDLDEEESKLNSNTDDVEGVFKDAWNKIDTLTEQQTLSKSRRYSTFSQTVKTAVEQVPVPRYLKDRRASSVMEHNLAKFQVPESYEGPKLSSGPVTPEQALAVLSFYSEHPNDNIPYRYAHKIVRDAKRLFQELNQPLIDLAIPKNGKIVVVGDIHGQLLDLFTVLRLSSFPSEKNYIIFNGDIVDRGPHGPSVVLVILALKLAHPEYIYINRGNHEVAIMNEWYNFADQMRASYDQEIYEYISEIWRWLPYVTLIDKQVFVVHGGLPGVPDFSLDDVKKIALGTDLASRGDDRNRTQLVMEGLLWSDPSADVLLTAPSPRGAGVLFGKQWTKDFLTRNNLKLIVRSHELSADGYQTFFGNRVITIFSASCYDYTNDNRGAILTFEYGLEDYCSPIVSQYFAELPTIVKSSEDQSHTMRTRRVVSTLYRIKEMIFRHKHELFLAFWKNDAKKFSAKSESNSLGQKAPDQAQPPPKNRGWLTLDEWDEILSEVLTVKINWRVLRPYLLPSEDTESVCYTKFLKRYVTNKKFSKRWARELVAQIATIIFNMSLDLDTAFKRWDLDGDGFLGYPEIQNFLILECNFSLNADQVADFVLFFDRDGDGHISLEEFHSFLDSEWKIVIGAAEWLNKARETISKVLSVRVIGLRSSFKLYNKSGNGKLTFREFSDMIRELQLNEFSEEDIEAIFGYLDTEDVKYITVKQFKRAFGEQPKQTAQEKEVSTTKVTTTATTSTSTATTVTSASTTSSSTTAPAISKVQSAVIVQQVVDVLSEYRLELRKEFRNIDVESCGTVTVEEFKAVIFAANQHLNEKLTAFQMSKLFEHLDVDSYGFVLYDEFLTACESATRMPAKLKNGAKIEKLLEDL